MLRPGCRSPEVFPSCCHQKQSWRSVRHLALTAFFGISLLFSVQNLHAANPMEETITIDPNARARPFPHFWEQIFGSGRANLSLRESYRNDLRATKNITELQYVRFHAIFQDENGIYDEDQRGNPVYNFSYVDQIYDGLLENGAKPFIELSFMPRKLALNLTPHPFWYKQLPSPPRDPQKWAALIEAFTKHLVERYGLEEVKQWYFEVWNEPNIDFWNGEPKQETYFSFYDVTVKAVKRISADLPVGGPGTAQAAWIPQFLDHCKKNNIPVDFVTTHVYGNDRSEDVFGTQEKIPRKDFVARSVRKVYDEVKKSPFPNLPIIWSEYNATYLTDVNVTDSAFMGPWLANNIRLCDGLTASMAYWTFSDVFEEQGVVKMPFYGGYGLIAERSIPKAAFRAFELLHKLGDTRLENASENAIVTKRKDGTIVLALWNYSEPDDPGKTKTFHLKGAKSKHYRIQYVDPAHGSALKQWEEMGKPAFPTKKQIAELVKASELPPSTEHTIGTPLHFASKSLAIIELR